MRWRERRQRLDQTPLCTRSKVRVHVRALLRSMPELCLHGLDRVAGGDGLTHDRVAAEGVVAERSKPNRAATAPSSVKGDPDRRGGRPLSIRMTRSVSQVKSMLATAGSPGARQMFPA
jgi:hypothetical protein